MDIDQKKICKTFEKMLNTHNTDCEQHIILDP